MVEKIPSNRRPESTTMSSLEVVAGSDQVEVGRPWAEHALPEETRLTANTLDNTLDVVDRQNGYRCPLASKIGPSSCLQYTLASREGNEIALSMSHTPLQSLPHEKRYQSTALCDVYSPKDRRRIEQDIISAASHELLSPLNLIGGYIATLLEFGEILTIEQKTRYLQCIESSTSRAVQIAKNFLEVSRLEASYLDLTIENTSLPRLLRRVVSEIQDQTTTHVIRLQRPRSLPSVNIDHQKIERVITNLLVNAVKYSPQGKDIEVSIRHAGGERELVDFVGEESLIKAPCLIVAIKDSGVGIPGVELEQVFKKFYRVHNKLTQVTSGVGLGLYICKVIVEAHGGHICARSKEGEGSTFIFSLPIAQSDPSG